MKTSVCLLLFGSIFILGGVSLAQEAKPDKTACAKLALPPMKSTGDALRYTDSDTDKKIHAYANLGIIAWNDGKSKDLQIATEGGTFTINSQGTCNNSNPTQTLSSLIDKELNSLSLLDMPSKNKKKCPDCEKDLRDALNQCDGFSNDVSATVAQLWQKYREALKVTAPDAGSVGRHD